MTVLVQQAKGFFSKVLADNLTGEAAKVAYYFFLSLFPLILVLFSLTGLLGGDEAFRWIMAGIQGTVPAETAGYLAEFVAEITGQPRPGLLSIGILLTLWSASGVFAALGDGLNTIYGVEHPRSWLRRRAIALALLVLGSALFIVGATLILAGPDIAEALRLGFVWRALSVPLAFVPLVLLMWSIYYVLPNRNLSHAKGSVLAGAVVGTLIWMAATYLFRLYVTNFGSYDKTYGFVGAVILLLLWLYVTALAILFGGEVAAQLEGRAGRG